MRRSRKVANEAELAQAKAVIRIKFNNDDFTAAELLIKHGLDVINFEHGGVTKAIDDLTQRLLVTDDTHTQRAMELLTQARTSWKLASLSHVEQLMFIVIKASASFIASGCTKAHKQLFALLAGRGDRWLGHHHEQVLAKIASRSYE